MRILKRILKIMLITLALCVVSIPLVSCASKSDSALVLENQVVTVQRGNLIIDITAVGNLALSVKEDLAFDIFYAEATVEEVLVEEGDTVKEGQELAKLDISEWEDELTTLERQLEAKRRDLLQAGINVEKAEIARYQATVFQWPEVELAQADLDKAKYYVEYAHKRLADAPDDNKAHWSRLVAKAEEDLIRAEDNLNVLLSGTATDEVVIKKLEVELAEGRLEDAQKAVEDAQGELDEAKSKSPIITAPFDGFIAWVNAEGGDEVNKGHVAVTLADPNKFEAALMVSEMDILQVKLGGEATVQVDAMPGMSLPAKVTHIAPTATIQSGVVNYTVKVEIQSLQAVMQERQEARQKATEGELPEQLRKAIEEGRITQEEAEEMIKQGQQGLPTMIPEDFQLREGLTVTVSILVEEKNDVLLVPNGAITRRGMETYVQVVKDGVIEERSIKTGISDWQYTEVTDGLNEGEQVVVPQGTTTTPTTPAPRSPMPLFPGGGPH